MRTRTVSVRLAKDDADRLEKAAVDMGVERSTFLKWAIKRGAGDLMLDRACDAYRRGQATLSRAAEMAGLSLRELILRMPEKDLHLAYSAEDLAEDLERP
jgi:predicted HTH domain antitoxin